MKSDKNARKDGSFFHFLKVWKNKSWFFINIFFTVMYLVWRVFFTIPLESGWISIAAGVGLLIIEILGMVEAFVHFANMYSVQNYPLPEAPLERFPHVDILVPTYNESTYILYKTINACKHLKYPDKTKLHIYLCDDGRRDSMRELAQQMGVHYLRREDNKGAKAGNMNNALKHCNSPYLVTIDADMLLMSDFLMKTVPYFVDCEIKNEGRKEKDKIKLGFIQTPQSFYNPDLFQFNWYSEGRVPNEQDYFYKDIQVARTKTNSVIYGGSNTVLSREALDSVGGFYTDAITEDFATGILIQKNQYVSLGLGETLASGLSATDLDSLINQRVRWGRGVIDTGKKMHIFTSSDLSFPQKMNYWASIWYWYAPIKRLLYIMCPILFATFGFMVVKCTLPEVLMFWLPMYITSNTSLRMLSGNIRNTKLTGIYETSLFPFMLLPVMLETVGISLKKFKVTDKNNSKTQNGSLIHSIPFIGLIILSIIGIVNCVVTIFKSGDFGPVVVLFWLITNLYLLIMSLFFVYGRKQYREFERVAIKVPCIIDFKDMIIDAATSDISEKGIAVITDKPYNFNESEAVKITMLDGKIQLDTKVVYVKKLKDGKWFYAMTIESYNSCYDEWLQLIYDRVPMLPTTIRANSGVVDDLRLNIGKRVEEPFYEKRKLPRILLNKSIKCSEFNSGRVTCVDFNYQYITLSSNEHREKIQLKLTDKLLLKCTYNGVLHNKLILYKIDNNIEIDNDPVLRGELLEWLLKNETSNEEFITADKATHKKKEIDIKSKPEEFNEMNLVS